MGSLSHLGIGLSFLFGCFLLGLVSELYYLLWWKKRFTSRGIENPQPTNNATEISHHFCWKIPNFVNGGNGRQELPTSVKKPADFTSPEQDLELGGNGKDLVLKSYGEEGVESELMRLHNLCGPPRFLFTIKEETNEDLESDDGKSRGESSSNRKGSRTKNLSDLFAYGESPYLTPLASPSLKAKSLDSSNPHGFKPLFESSTDAEINGLRFSPPPKFKFLRDAEEKLMRKLMEAAEKKCQLIGDSVQDSAVKKEEKDDSFVTVFASQNKQIAQHSQVLPLATSPTAFRHIDNQSAVQSLSLN